MGNESSCNNRLWYAYLRAKLCRTYQPRRHDYDYSGETLVIVDDVIILDALMFMVWLSCTPMQIRLWTTHNPKIKRLNQ